MVAGEGGDLPEPSNWVSGSPPASGVAPQGEEEPAKRGGAPCAGPAAGDPDGPLELGEIYAYTAVDTYTREAQVVLRPGLTSGEGRKALEQVMVYFGGLPDSADGWGPGVWRGV